jgi:aminoacrylate peracid reductase
MAFKKVPLSPGALAGNTLYVAGMVSVDQDQKNVIHVGDIRKQTRQVIEYIKAVVEEAGGTLQDVAFNSIFIRDLADFWPMNEVYAEYFTPNPPPRYCIRADMMLPECLVEICSIAHLQSKAELESGES